MNSCVSVHNKTALVLVMTCRRTSNRPWPKPRIRKNGTSLRQLPWWRHSGIGPCSTPNHYLNNTDLLWICSLEQISLALEFRKCICKCGLANVCHLHQNLTSIWWRHQMETFSALLAPCAVTGEFPSQRPVAWSFDDFFDLRLNKWLSKQLIRRWFETPSCSLWHFHFSLNS